MSSERRKYILVERNCVTGNWDVDLGFDPVELADSVMEELKTRGVIHISFHYRKWNDISRKAQLMNRDFEVKWRRIDLSNKRLSKEYDDEYNAIQEKIAEIYAPHYAKYGHGNLPYCCLEITATSRWRLVKFKDKNWRSREACRMEDGTYSVLPWKNLPPIEDHFAHVSVSDGAMISYTPDDAKGQLDIQVKTKAGRYLTKFYPQMHPDTVRSMATELDKSCEPKFGSTEDDFEAVYTKGPRSCMSHTADYFSSSIHPCRMYAAGDLQIAYLSTHKIGERGFHPTARVIVWPAKKIYTRFYGDGDRLRPALERMGYKFGHLVGAKLLRKQERSSFVVPYVDGEDGIKDCKTHLEINRDGYITCCSTNGLSNDDECEEHFCEGHESYGCVDDEDDMSHVRGVGMCCPRWIDSNAFYCEGYGEYFAEDDDQRIETADCGNTYSERWAQRNCHYHEESDAWYDHEENVPKEEPEYEFKCVAYSDPNGHWIDGDKVALEVDAVARIKGNRYAGNCIIREVDGDGCVLLSGPETWYDVEDIVVWATHTDETTSDQMALIAA